MMKRRTLYVCNAFEDTVQRVRSVTGDSPAASGKVIALCNAVRLEGGQPYIVSLGRQRQRGSWRWHPSAVRRAGGVPIVYAAYYDAPVLTHVVSAVSLVAICLRVARRRSTWVFYNFLAYYVPTLLAGRLFGNCCILDLEDGVRFDDRSLRSRIGRVVLSLHNALCDRAMVASSALVSQTPLRPTIVCYGVAPTTTTRKHWDSSELRVLFSGALLADTGVDLFLGAVGIIAKHPGAAQLKFVVTGFGGMSHKIEDATKAYRRLLEFRGRVTSEEYLAILTDCHIGLCLKMPATSMGATTFPSKVVEMAGHGLLIISTRVSDVPALLADQRAVLLDQPTPDHLAAALCAALDSRKLHAEIARRGQAHVASELSAHRVGAQLLEFWGSCAPGVPETSR